MGKVSRLHRKTGDTRLGPRSRPAPSATALRRGVDADHATAVIQVWAGLPKAFGTRTLYVAVCGAVTALLAMTAVIALGFDVAILTIIVIGVGLSGIVWFVAPPAWCRRVAVRNLRVGDIVAAADDDFVIRAAPVVAITQARRGATPVIQVATASGSAYEVEEFGSLPVVHFSGFVGRIPANATGIAELAHGAAHGSDRHEPWPWAEIVADLVARLLHHQRGGGSAPTRDQVREDLVIRTGCTRATARYALVAATGLGLVSHGRNVSVTPAGVVWSVGRSIGVGSRIEAPTWSPLTVSLVESTDRFADVSDGRLRPGGFVDVSGAARGHSEGVARGG